MAGNSRRQGAVRKSKKGAQVGSGGQSRRALKGTGPHDAMAAQLALTTP